MNNKLNGDTYFSYKQTNTKPRSYYQHILIENCSIYPQHGIENQTVQVDEIADITLNTNDII